VALLSLTLVFCLVLEMGTRHWLGRTSRIRHRIELEYQNARVLNSKRISTPRPILLLGNSLLKESVDISKLQQELAPEFKPVRLVIESTAYLDWYYGLKRLFREGSQPEMVVIGLDARGLLSRSVADDNFGLLLMDLRDLLNVRRDTGQDRTATSNLFFANFSVFYGSRSHIRKWILGELLPDLQEMTSRFTPPKPPLPPDSEIQRIATVRLRALQSLCGQHDARLIFVVAPTHGLPGLQPLLRAGKDAGVPIVVPLAKEMLTANVFAEDGYHLNQNGAKVFTAALMPMLRDKLMNGNQNSWADGEIAVESSGHRTPTEGLH
jgi:hypothetical protein